MNVKSNMVKAGNSKMLRRIFLGLLLSSVSIFANAKDVPGATQTSYGVSASGAFQFQIPIVLPQGRNGVQPNLSLGFSSSGGNGIVGVGWGVSGLGAITRCGKTIATNGVRGGVQHNEDDRFCLNGQQLILVAGTYGASGSEYRTEIDQFARIVATGNASVNVNGGNAPSSWKVWRKDGSIHDYGLDPTTQFKLPGTNSIHRWNLSRVSDRNDNYYKVQYRAKDGQPTQIDYTYGTGLTAKQQVLYSYEPRPDVRTGYVLGSQIIRDDRLASIVVKNNGEIVREYRLAYNTAWQQVNNPVGIGSANDSNLRSVTECGMNGECMPPINIEWQAKNDGYQTATQAKDKAPDDLIQYYNYQAWNGGSTSEPRVKELNRGAWVDVNGDGEVDQVIAVRMPNGTNVLKTHIKTATGWQDQPSWHLPRVLRSYQDSIVNSGPGRFDSNVINQGLFSDVNGDGLVDIVYSYEHYTAPQQYGATEKIQLTYLNTGSGWQLSTAYEPKDIIFDYLSNGSGGSNRSETVRGRLIDINGDGLVDWLTAYWDYTSNGNGIEHKTTWLNNGNGWSRAEAYDMPDVFVEYRNAFTIQHGQFVDVNGDGLQDWVRAYWRALDTARYGTWLNTGNGWQPAPEYNLPEPIFDNQKGWDSSAPNTRGSFIDVNGDGLRDWVRSYQTHSNYQSRATLLNTGKGWVVDTSYRVPFVHLDHTFSDFTRNWGVNARGNYVDFNRDGLVDYVESYKSVAIPSVTYKNAWVNTGSSFQPLPSNSPYIPTDVYYDYSGRENSTVRKGDMIDINSDGAVDWVRNRVGMARHTRLHKINQLHQVASITTTMGVVVKPTFLPLTDGPNLYIKGAGVAEDDSQQIVGNMYVTSKLEISRPDGAGYNTATYRYAGAQVHRKGRGFLGFKERWVTNVDRGTTAYTRLRQDYPFIGRAINTQSKVGDRVVSDHSYSWVNVNITHSNDALTKFPYSDSDREYTQDLDSGEIAIKDVFRQKNYDDYGNLLVSRTEVKDGLGTVLSDVTTTNTYLQENTTDWLVNLLDTTTTLLTQPGQQANLGQQDISRVTKYNYYPNGQLQESIREPNNSESGIKLITSYTYDGSGNQLAESMASPSDNESRVNAIGYDTSQRLPISLSNALNQTSTITYHQQCDQPSRVTNINGLEIIYSYDNFCREVSVTDVAGNTAVTDYSVSPSLCGTDCQTQAKLAITTEKDGESPITTYLNAFGQPMVTVTTGMLARTIKQVTEYDRFGRTKRALQPYFESDTPYWVEQQYDVLDRLRITTLPFNNYAGQGAAITHDYSVDARGLQVRATTDAENHTKTSYANALGQIVEVKDPRGASLTYVFDPQGNLIRTTDVANNSIVIEYDQLGRRIVLDDPDLGRSTYTHNSFSEQLTQTNAKGQTLSMIYDKLSRLTQRTVPTSGAPEISTWEYDTATNGVGAVAKIIGPNGFDKTYSYDMAGRLASDLTTIQGEAYAQSYAYNADGFLSERFYPNSGGNNAFGVKYEYQNGFLASIKSIEADPAQCIEHWRADKYDAAGRSEQETLGRVVTTNRIVDQAQGVLNKIKAVRTRGNQATVQELEYSYDGVNNLITRNDVLAGLDESFEYDELDRMNKHYRGAQTTEVHYDSIGNITYKSDVGIYSYTQSGGPHALSKVTSSTDAFDPTALFQVNWDWDGSTQTKAQPAIQGAPAFTYDANGNVITSGNRSFEWTAFDKPSMMQTTNPGLPNNFISRSELEYDADFNRIMKRESRGENQASVETTIYIGKEYERITNSSETVHRYTIAAGSNTIQIERQDGSGTDQPKYLLSDHLGSPSVILNALGEIEQTLAFDPWGMRMNVGPTLVNGITNRGFTGHEMDDEIGVINMNARIYDPYLGVFLSADPVLQDPHNMASYNRYSYVWNNPLKYTDPTGNIVEGGASGILISSAIASAFDFIFGLGGSGRPQCNCINTDIPMGGAIDSVSGLGGFFFNLDDLDVAAITAYIGEARARGESNDPEGNGEGPNIDIPPFLPPGGESEECNTPQCRVDRLNARVTADFPDLARPTVRAASLPHPIIGLFVDLGLVLVDGATLTDDQLQATIFHERLHADDAFFHGENTLITYGIGENFRHRGGHDPFIDFIVGQYNSYLSGGGSFFVGGVDVNPLPNIYDAPWRTNPLNGPFVPL